METAENKTIFDYIEQYGDCDFSNKPFNEIDAAVFSQLVYNEFDGIVDRNDSKLSLKDACDLFFERYSETELENLIDVSARAAMLLKCCAKTKRFGETELLYYINNINDRIDKQIAAVNFLLSDGSLMVAFRGTDVTATGFKESMMLSYMFPVPAQIEALHYFQETAMLHSGDVRISGHSKGGNLAIFAAVNCSNSLKKKVTGVYACDAPGFPKWFFDRYDYKQIEDKIFLYTPQSSVVGRILFNAKKPEIIVSSLNGIKQHRVSSWEVDDDRFVRTEEYDTFSNDVSSYINDLIDYINDDDLEDFYNAIEIIFNSVGVVDFYDLKKMNFKSTLTLIDHLSILDPEQKVRFKSVIKKAFSEFTRRFISSKAKSHIKDLKLFSRREKPETEENSEM